MLYLFVTLKALAAWVIMSLVGTNLIGFVMNGLFLRTPPIDSILNEPGATERVKELISHEINRAHRNNAYVTIIFILVTIAYLFAIYHFWNVYLFIAALVLMVARVPDVLWEIETGLRVRSGVGPKGAISTMSSSLYFLVLPLIWYAFYRGHG